MNEVVHGLRKQGNAQPPPSCGKRLGQPAGDNRSLWIERGHAHERAVAEIDERVDFIRNHDHLMASADFREFLQFLGVVNASCGIARIVEDQQFLVVSGSLAGVFEFVRLQPIAIFSVGGNGLHGLSQHPGLGAVAHPAWCGNQQRSFQQIQQIEEQFLAAGADKHAIRRRVVAEFLAEESRHGFPQFGQSRAGQVALVVGVFAQCLLEQFWNGKRRFAESEVADVLPVFPHALGGLVDFQRGRLLQLGDPSVQCKLHGFSWFWCPTSPGA